MESQSPFYGRFAITLHWLVAACIVFVVIFAWAMDEDDAQSATLMIHKSFGVTIFILACVRLAWRAGHPPPPLPKMNAFQRVAAKATHVTLYALIFLMPVTGYISVAARGRNTSFFGLFDLPMLAPLSRALAHQMENLHGIGQYALYVLLAAHVGATVYHQFVLKDGLFNRMWPRR